MIILPLFDSFKCTKCNNSMEKFINEFMEELKKDNVYYK